MFSEKQFREWQSRRPEIEERERERIRAQVGEQVDATLAQIRRESEARAGRERFQHARRHASAVRQMAEPVPAETPEQRSARRALIRTQVERDVTAWENERAAQARQTRG